VADGFIEMSNGISREMDLTETHKEDKFVFYASHNPSNDNKIIVQIN
jgi:hypothetical protein